MYALASFEFGFRRSKITRNDKKILCIRQNYVSVEFFQTICLEAKLWRKKFQIEDSDSDSDSQDSVLILDSVVQESIVQDSVLVLDSKGVD